MSKPTVAEYAVDRLAKLGITDCFGLPGDYAFPINDAIASHKSIEWRGCSNELNASYAADGYARIRGASMLNTTYAVGELSALCGVMGAKAERSTIFHLVGMSSMRHQHLRKHVHHTLGDGVFQNFINISAQSACVYAILTPDNCVYEMERVIATAMANRQPAYIIVAEDLATRPITGPALEPFPEPKSDAEELKAAVDAALAKLEAAKTGCILPAFTISRFGLQPEVTALIEASGLPFATTAMDKAAISEGHPQFLGGYAGKFSAPNVVEAVEGCDVVINAGGVLFTDISTAAFAHDIDPAKMITIGIDHTQVDGRVYSNVRMRDMFVALAAKVKKFADVKLQRPAPATLVGGPNDPITQESLPGRYQQFLQPNDILVAETGTSAVATGGLLMPEGAVYHNQTLWGSIGWATGTALGTAIADRSRRTVLITGEGSHQLTANELGNYGRHGVKPVIFVLNNSGYGVERVLEKYPDWVYNDLAPWDYHTLPAALGCKDWFTAKVQTNGELDAAMQKAEAADTASYIEIVGQKHDYPAGLKLMGSRAYEMYG
ncbi:MAG TPA: thiamine pyrophosphate-binding protein, partial [Chromatiaceae bacterium]|nr:thiamine pyrophosphate-binding protein [Chromatiaceae bacterium]